MGGDTVRFGILGNSWIARDFFIPALHGARNCRVTAIASRAALDPAFLPELTHYDSYDALLAAPDIDAVYVPLPNALHKEWSIRAMECKKHVLCEKPIALNATECADMMRAAKKNNVVLMEAFMYHYSDKTRILKEVLSSGILGAIRGIYGCFGYMLDWDSPARQDPTLGGGCLYDVGCYCVNFISMVMQQQGRALTDAGATFRMQGGVDIHTSAWLNYEGVPCTLDCYFDGMAHQEMRVFGEKGMLYMPRAFLSDADELLLTTAEGTSAIPTAANNSYKLEAEAFAGAVLKDPGALIPLEDTQRYMHVLDQLYRTNKT